MTREYYILGDEVDDRVLGFQHSEIWKLPFMMTSWVSGFPMTDEISVPIEVELNPEFGTELVDSYQEYIPLWSTSLLTGLLESGVDNIQTYDAIISDPRTGLDTNTYKAVNIVGLVDCSDMELSEYDSASERYAREFTKLVLDADKAGGFKLFRLPERPTMVLITGDVKEHLQKKGLKGLKFTPVETNK